MLKCEHANMQIDKNAKLLVFCVTASVFHSFGQNKAENNAMSYVSLNTLYNLIYCT